jgi:sarcosine oxidase subunit alpha
VKQPCRLRVGGLIDRDRTLAFTFNGTRYEGYAGDTLASALLANGVRLVARSFKYHRPRGIVAAGVEEPNALVQMGDVEGDGARDVPNLKATEIELFDGLSAASVNVFPSVRFDAGALIGTLSRFMPAGFYYKTFFGSPALWHRVFEPLIRRAGGWGRAPGGADPDYYDRMHAHCDVLIVGGGPAGIAAATGAAAGGARVILADENDDFGGSLRQRKIAIDGMPGGAWLNKSIDALQALDEVRLLRRTAVSAYFDGNYLVALERRGHEGEPSSPARTRQRLWHIRARQIILATGAHERPPVFANNDRPGVMLAGAVQAYVKRFAVLPGKRAVFFVNNDRAYESLLDCHDAGLGIAALVDSRREPAGPLIDAARERGIDLLFAHAVCDTGGRRALNAVTVAPLMPDGGIDQTGARRIACDLLAVSGGYSPAVHLHSQSGGTLRYDERLCCFRPQASRQAQCSVGAGNATFELAAALDEAQSAGLRAAASCGWPARESPPLPVVEEIAAAPPEALWLVTGLDGQTHGGHRHFVDLQNDSSVADIRMAVREGFDSVEHMKRYTLTGFGTDQGKISNINGLAILASIVGRTIPEVGTTTFRPPYTPVTFAAMGGRDRGALFEPARLTAMHDQHVAAGAVFEDVGQWKRPWYYPRAGEGMNAAGMNVEDMAAAVARECAAVRGSVGVLDASTLGKIDIQGPDAAEFLNRVYTNAWNKLAVGRVRYGVMCREDGMVFDDGTTSRIDEQRYLMTTTTGGAAAVLDHLEEYLQTEWPHLRVRLTSVTEQWSTVAIAGPRSRDVLSALAPDLDLSPAGFPFLSWRDAEVAGLPARVFRISFTGELQFEVNVPWHYGAALWSAVMTAGAPFDITPYGTETMHVLRAEKGFIIAGQETDGTQTPRDLGLDWLLAEQKDFIGRRSQRREDTMRCDRPQLVGLRPVDPGAFIPEGTQLVERGMAATAPPVRTVGFVTSSYRSVALRTHFCLALVNGGRQRHGDTFDAALPGGAVPVTVCKPVFYDPDNRRRDG